MTTEEKLVRTRLCLESIQREVGKCLRLSPPPQSEYKTLENIELILSNYWQEALGWSRENNNAAR